MGLAAVSTQKYCPKCGSPGQVHQRTKGGSVICECFECGNRWTTTSPLCPICKKPNGYAVEGICMQCYAELREWREDG